MPKTLDYYRRLPRSANPDGAGHISLIQPNISGGRITREQIDTVRDFPSATAISISGLTKDTFDYFVEGYGQQFKAIHFWKCSLVPDLRRLESLERIEYIVYFWNQRARELWDFSKTPRLKGLAIDDFTRLHELSQLAGSPALEELHFGDKIWDQFLLESLGPLAACRSVKFLSFSARKILDGRIEPLAEMRSLERLSFPPRLFSTEQVAWLKAHLPDDVESEELAGYRHLKHPVNARGKRLDMLIVGRRKPFLDSDQDRARVKEYAERFEERCQWFRLHPGAAPEEYKRGVSG
jgi:hypothetical protein